MGTVLLVIVGGTVALASLALALGPAAQTLRTLRALGRRTRIAEAREGGPVILVGMIDSTAGPLESPLTRQQCVAYDVQVTDLYRSGHPILAERKAVDFTIRDDTGTALVSSGGALDLRHMANVEAVASAGPFRPTTDAMEALLARHEQSSQGRLVRRMLSFSERVLRLGDQVVVAGLGVSSADPRGGARIGGYRDAPRRFVLESTPELGLGVSNDPEVVRRMSRR